LKAISKLTPREELQNPMVIPLVHGKHKKPEGKVVQSLKSTVKHQRAFDDSKDKVLTISAADEGDTTPPASEFVIVYMST